MPKVSQKDLTEFGRAVERARSLKTWTLDELGGELNPPVGKSFVSKVEKGRKTNLTSRTVGRFIAALEMDQTWIDRFIGVEGTDDDVETDAEKSADAIIAQIFKEGEAVGVTEALLIALANEYTEDNTADLQSAYKGLRAALQTARDMAQRAELKDNTDASVAAIRARVDALNKDGEPEAAAEVIDEAIAQKTAEMAAVLDLGVQQDRLRNDPKAAADKIILKLRYEMPLADLFEPLRDMRNAWMMKGRDYDLTFDSRVSIFLAELLIAEARDLAESIEAEFHVAHGILELGKRETSSIKLNEAIRRFAKLYESAEAEDRVYHMGVAQKNLGTAFLSLALLNGGVANLTKSIESHLIAADIFAGGDNSTDLAMSLEGLGTAKAALGQIRDNPTLVKESIADFRRAAALLDRSEHPLEWGHVQMNLGICFTMHGRFTNAIVDFLDAKKALESALEVLTEEKAPSARARTQMNLGNVLLSLGELKNDVEYLLAAVGAYRETEIQWTPETAAQDWALTQANLANTEVALAQTTRDITWLDKANDNAKNAWLVLQLQPGTPQNASVLRTFENIEKLREALS